MICPKCKKEYSGYPAVSRRDKTSICPKCGQIEAVEDAIESGAMSKETADEILESLSRF